MRMSALRFALLAQLETNSMMNGMLSQRRRKEKEEAKERWDSRLSPREFDKFAFRVHAPFRRTIRRVYCYPSRSLTCECHGAKDGAWKRAYLGNDRFKVSIFITFSFPVGNEEHWRKTKKKKRKERRKLRTRGQVEAIYTMIEFMDHSILVLDRKSVV